MAKTMKAFLVYCPSLATEPYGVVLAVSHKEAVDQIEKLGNFRIEGIPLIT